MVLNCTHFKIDLLFLVRLTMTLVVQLTIFFWVGQTSPLIMVVLTING